MVNVLLRILGAMAVVLALAEARAHHAYATDFDPDAYGTVTGKVVEIFFINPHAQYVIDVTGADGSTRSWAVILQNLNTMASVGWSEESVSIGETIEVYGRLGRDGRPLIWPQTIVREDGATLDMGRAGPLK